MKFEKLIHHNNKEYINFTEIVKYHSYSKNSPYRKSITQEKSKIPLNHFVTPHKRGRNSKTFIDKDGLYLWINFKRDLENDLKKHLLEFITKPFDNAQNSPEGFFINLLCDFLKGMNSKLLIEKQKNILKYNVDLCISNKLVIEFNESHHKSNIVLDKKRHDDILNKGYKIIIVKSTDIYGLSIANIYQSLILI
jgi:very-short-patch-repair endonuclease